MTKLIAEFITSIDMAGRGTRSPGLYGYSGPEMDAWLADEDERDFRQVLGRKTYEMLSDLPDEAKDDNWKRMAERRGLLFSRSLKACDWPGLEIVSDDPVKTVAAAKDAGGPDLKTAGSLSIVRQLAHAGLIDVLRLVQCPLVVPETGIEPIFARWPDTAFDLASHRLLDGRVLVLDYRPAGKPPTV